MKKTLTFIVSLGVYPYDIMFSFGESDKQLKKSIENVHLKWIPEMEMENSHSGSGRYLLLEGNQSLVRVYNFPDNPADIGTLSHEIFHAVYQILRTIGMKLSDESEEAYAYLIGYITAEIFRRIDEITK